MGTRLSRRGAAQAQNAEQPVPDSKLSRSLNGSSVVHWRGPGHEGSAAA